MAASQKIQNAFVAGELSEQLDKRVDFDKFYTGARLLKNTVSQPHGGATKRPGFLFVGELPGPAKLKEFSFSDEQTFVLCFGNNWLRIANQDGFLADADGNILHLPSPYTYEQAKKLDIAQNYDSLYIACPNVAPRKLVRWSNTQWEFILLRFESPVAKPGTVTAERDGSTSPAVTPYTYYVSAVNKDKIESEASKSNTIIGPSYINWSISDGIKVTWPRIIGTGDGEVEKYFVYKSSHGGAPLYVATINQPDSGATVSWRDENKVGDVSKGPVFWDNPFPNEDNSGNDFPSVVTIYEQRLVYAGSVSEPSTLIFSRIGFYEDFSYSDPLSSADSFDFKLAANRVSRVRWMDTLRNLVVGAASNEWEVYSNGAGFSATTAARRISSNYGSTENVPGINIGSVILHVTRSQNVVRDLQYQFNNDTFGGLDRSILATHLFENKTIVDWSYQQSPNSVVWCVRDDGMLLGLTIMLEQNIYAWHRHETQGKFIHVLCIAQNIKDVLFAVIERNGKYYLERMDEQYYSGDYHTHSFSDSSKKFSFTTPTNVITGLEHLEGMEVCILGDGAVFKNTTVTNGQITLDSEVSYAVVGLPYSLDIISMSLESGSESLTRKKTITAVNLSLRNTMKVLAGISGRGMREFVENKSRSKSVPYGSPPNIITDDIRLLTGGQGTQLSVRILNEEPTPVTILAWAIEYVLS